ncbi:YpdA family putative bacillithiol disulfide reductase [Ferruginibacter yonginensis]|uniref:YpdA family putative bacillithiol disulfide reductase n=1 Tax=Ferruginibacter yonginensis TaxID=1310416 RepID=A0ABV8QUP4_9BACT
MLQYDVVIVGGGPIGLACAIAAQQKGLKYVVVEKGCLVNSIYGYPTNMTFFSTSEKLEIGNIPFVSNNNKPTRAEALEYYRRTAIAHQLNIQLFEPVTKIENKQHVFEITTTKQQYNAQFVIIATGFYDLPFLLNVPGEALPKVVHYYKDPHFYAMQQVLVVGAQNSAIDAALETYRKGAKVTLVIRGSEVGERVKYWVRPDVMNRIAEGAIKVYYNTTVKEILPTEVILQTPDGIETIPNDFVLALTGYQPNLQFLEDAGVTLSNDAIKKPTYNENTHETNVPNLFLAGVICGGMDTHSLFIENSRVHATAIIETIVGRLTLAH